MREDDETARTRNQVAASIPLHASSNHEQGHAQQAVMILQIACIVQGTAGTQRCPTATSIPPMS